MSTNVIDPAEIPSFQWPEQSAYAREMRKWNKPYRFERYPAMVYKAKKRPTGGPFICVDPFDEAFTRECQRVVQVEAEYEQAVAEGWRDSPQEAIDHALALERAVSDAAAHRNWEDRNMGERAKAEAAAVESATDGHVAEVPEALRRRGRRSA